MPRNDQDFGDQFSKDESKSEYKVNSNNRASGFILIAIGIVWLLSKFTNFNIFSFSALYKIWPLAFVVIGINILFQNKRYIRYISWIIFIAIIILFSNTELKVIDTGIPELNIIQSKVIEKVKSNSDIVVEYEIEKNFDNENYKNFVKSHRLESNMLVEPDSRDSKDYFKLSDMDLERANLVLSINSASLNLKAGDQNTLTSTYDYLDVFEKIDDEFGFYVITKEKYQNIDKRSNRDVDIEILRDMEWNLQLNSGAINCQMDLSDVKLNTVEINSGASSYEIKLPSDSLNLKFNAGASDVKFEVAKDLGVHLKVNGLLVDTKIDNDEFYKDGSDYYSNNYENAKNKALIEVNVAAGKVEIKSK